MHLWTGRSYGGIWCAVASAATFVGRCAPCLDAGLRVGWGLRFGRGRFILFGRAERRVVIAVEAGNLRLSEPLGGSFDGIDGFDKLTARRLTAYRLRIKAWARIGVGMWGRLGGLGDRGRRGW